MASTPGPGPVMEFLGHVAYEVAIMKPMMPTYLHLLISAIFPIYIAAHSALAQPSSAAKPKKTGKEGDSTDSANRIEGLTPSDALLFPLLAGVTLTSLFFILKWLEDPAWLNYILGIYFSWVGVFFAVKFLKDILSFIRSVFLPTQYSAHGLVWEYSPYSKRDHFRAMKGRPGVLKEDSPLPGFLRKLPLPAFMSKAIWKVRRAVYAKANLQFHIHKVITVKASIDCLDIVSFVASALIAYYHSFIDKPWFLTNFFGFAFCYGSLQLVSPTTAWTGTLILLALFFYDIYFVFFTPMMVTVATKLDVPIKLLFPRPDGCILPIGAAEGSPAMEEYLRCLAKKRTMAMLGLGDIVIPGWILAYALRFDLFLFYFKKTTIGENGKHEKAVYLPATESWGERFWTSKINQSAELRAKSFPKTYFHATVIGYLLGLSTTVCVMQIANHAQPALLYLVPGVLISLWGTALVKGDLKALWNYNEDIEKEEPKKDENLEESKSSEINVKTIGQAKVGEKRDSEIALNDDEGKATIEVQGEIHSLDQKGANGSLSKSSEPKDTGSSTKKSDPEASCRTYFVFSLTKPDSPSLVPVMRRKTKATLAAEIKREQDFALSVPSKPTSSLSAGPSPAVSIHSATSDDDQEQEDAETDVLPDVAADNAVLAKLRKEVTAASAGTIDAKGGEPPEKRRRKA